MKKIANRKNRDELDVKHPFFTEGVSHIWRTIISGQTDMFNAEMHCSEIKMQMTEYQEVHDFLHDIKDYEDNGYEEEYKCRTHIFCDFHCQVVFIRTMNIQT